MRRHVLTYCLDTNVVMRALRGQQAQGIETKLKTLSPDNIKIPEMVRAELLTGVYKSARPAHHFKLVTGFLSAFETLPFGGEAADHYARIRVSLEQTGQIIGPNDLIIAATARSHGATIVTNNLKEFSRVPDLKSEDW